ncbi:hypothetical protein PoB_001584600 [Plakobranchus ocellatus]|uniref:Uncharacterized protein n=1 Tax=Plakobranchus ocellatus TaxID=259542 RepID=A0AAV3Z0K0_9GAST|nr:hypothetical protein PoB_001584600 [Plakobranchus ocellatus]
MLKLQQVGTMKKKLTHAQAAAGWDHEEEINTCSSCSSPEQGGLRYSGPPSGRGTGGGARTRDRRVAVDLRTDTLPTVPPMPLTDL